MSKRKKKENKDKSIISFSNMDIQGDIMLLHILLRALLQEKSVNVDVLLDNI